jgi:hypothetical protein
VVVIMISFWSSTGPYSRALLTMQMHQPESELQMKMEGTRIRDDSES